MAGNHSDLEKCLWDAADELRANSKLKSSEYSVPVLGLIFLRFADNKFARVEKELAAKSGQSHGEGELSPEATIRKFRIVQAEGKRQVERLVDHYNLDAILAVG